MGHSRVCRRSTHRVRFRIGRPQSASCQHNQSANTPKYKSRSHPQIISASPRNTR
jgi:hypothetical protein